MAARQTRYHLISEKVCEEQFERYALSSMYVKNPSAPPFAPRLTKRSTSTQSFMSFGIGRESGSSKNVRRIRVYMPMWLCTKTKINKSPEEAVISL